MPLNIAPAAGRQGPPGVGEPGPPGSRDLRQRYTAYFGGGTGGGAGTTTWVYRYESDDVVYIDMEPDGGRYIFDLPSGADARNTPIYIKRINNDPFTELVIQCDAAVTIDGGDRTITLGVTTAFGTNTGEAICMLFDDSSSTWRIL